MGKQSYARNPEILQLYNNRGVFARICSSIQLDSSFANELKRQKEEILNIPPENRTSQQKNDLQTIKYNLDSTAERRLLKSNFTQEFINSIKGRNFSKNFIIQGSVIKNPFSSLNFREVVNGEETDNYLVFPKNKQLGGVVSPNPDGSYNAFNAAYGWGSITTDGEGFGYAPPPRS